MELNIVKSLMNITYADHMMKENELVQLMLNGTRTLS